VSAARAEPAAARSTRDEATREAQAVAARNRPCDIVVHDAYHRVVHTAHVDAA
jgi:hypothetical protein